MDQYEIVKQLLKAKNIEEIEVALQRVNVYNYSSIIKTLVSRINTMHMESVLENDKKNIDTEAEWEPIIQVQPDGKTEVVIFYQCSNPECENQANQKTLYCSHCGRKMKNGVF